MACTPPGKFWSFKINLGVKQPIFQIQKTPLVFPWLRMREISRELSWRRFMESKSFSSYFSYFMINTDDRDRWGVIVISKEIIFSKGIVHGGVFMPWKRQMPMIYTDFSTSPSDPSSAGPTVFLLASGLRTSVCVDPRNSMLYPHPTPAPATPPAHPTPAQLIKHNWKFSSCLLGRPAPSGSVYNKRLNTVSTLQGCDSSSFQRITSFLAVKAKKFF